MQAKLKAGVAALTGFILVLLSGCTSLPAGQMSESSLTQSGAHPYYADQG